MNNSNALIVAEPVAGIVSHMIPRAQPPFRIDERTAPHDRLEVLRFNPGASVRRRTLVIIVPHVQAPLTNVAVQVVQSPGIRLLPRYRMRSMPGVGAMPSHPVNVSCEVPLRAGPAGIFPL